MEHGVKKDINKSSDMFCSILRGHERIQIDGRRNATLKTDIKFIVWIMFSDLMKGYHAFVTDIGHKLCVKCAMEDETGSNQLACISLDELLEESPQLSNPTLLRFNYGTGVVEALRGAAKILKTSQPKLAISIGFDEIGFVNIIHEIRKHNPNYKFYIRFQRCLPCLVRRSVVDADNL